MATKQFTHLALESAPACATIATPSADQGAERPLKVSIRPMGLAFWEYEGTRAQLEAENVIPPGIEWPEGAQSRYFNEGRFCYWLRRTRPDGMKGPKKLWSSSDWWFLRCDLIDGPSDAAVRILDQKRELAKAIYRQSPAGQREWDVNWNRHWKASQDKAFQDFKAIFIPRHKKPGPKSKPEAPRGTQGCEGL